MASIHVTNVLLMKNPANYTEEFSFHVRFDAIEELRSYCVLLSRQYQRNGCCETASCDKGLACRSLTGGTSGHLRQSTDFGSAGENVFLNQSLDTAFWLCVQL